MKRALFSLSNTDRVVEFAKELVVLGWEIIASQETVKILSEKNIPVVDIADFVGERKDYGFPSTLHPKVEWCLTSGESPEPISLVYVISYPLSNGNDVGGRTLLALAAKGDRVPVSSITDMGLVVGELKNKGEITSDLRLRLQDKVNWQISSHYDDLLRERKEIDIVFGRLSYELMNGENPYQTPAYLLASKDSDELSLHSFERVFGDAPCFTNLADSDCIIHAISITSEAFVQYYKKTPYICIAAKHGNPCGMSISWEDPLETIENALFGNPLAIWGGEVITNFEIGKASSRFLLESARRKKMLGDSSWMLDIILAPSFSQEAIGILGKRKTRKLLQNMNLRKPFVPKRGFSYRFVRGGIIKQPHHNFILNLNDLKPKELDLGRNIIDSLIIAWAVAYSSNHGGNEVALAKDGALVGCGGAPSTLEAAEFAIIKAERAGYCLEGGVFAANAYFPFIDAPEVLINKKIVAGTVPAGGKAFEDVKAFFRERDVEVFYIPEDYRGFCRH